MNFIRIPGIFTQRKWHHQNIWAEKVQEYFPGSITHYKHLYYSPLQRKKIREYVNDLVDEIKKSETPVVLVGSSYGGFIAHQVVWALQKIKKQPLAIVCYATPFIFWRFFQKSITPNILQMHFYGESDRLVPKWFSESDPCKIVCVIKGKHLSLARGENLDEFLGLIRQHLD